VRSVKRATWGTHNISDPTWKRDEEILPENDGAVMTAAVCVEDADGVSFTHVLVRRVRNPPFVERNL
jgi:hypothetical protein